MSLLLGEAAMCLLSRVRRMWTERKLETEDEYRNRRKVVRGYCRVEIEIAEIKTRNEVV